jgi:hypothetical protein
VGQEGHLHPARELLAGWKVVVEQLVQVNGQQVSGHAVVLHSVRGRAHISMALRPPVQGQDSCATCKVLCTMRKPGRGNRAHGLTLHELGNRVGYSAATMSRLEPGRQALHDIGTLRLLARKLQIPPSWLGLSALPSGEHRCGSLPPP